MSVWIENSFEDSRESQTLVSDGTFDSSFSVCKKQMHSQYSRQKVNEWIATNEYRVAFELKL